MSGRGPTYWNKNMPPETFTFAELDKRIEQIPDAPGEMVLFPKPLMVWEFIGIFGTILGLVPSLIVLFITPAMWMVPIAKFGLAIMVLGYLPGFVYKCWGLIKSMRNWREQFISGADFAFDRHRELTEWLMQFPKVILEDRMHFIRDARIRMGDKMGLVIGGIEKLGAVPVLLAVITQIQEFRDLGSLPAWRIVLAFFLVLMYAMSISISLMRLRAQLHEMLLTNAINKLNTTR